MPRTGNDPTAAAVSPQARGEIPVLVDLRVTLAEQQEQHDAAVELLTQRLNGVREACASRMYAVRAKCSARIALHALHAYASEADLWRQADAREGRMHAKLKRALQDRSPPPTVLWQEREEELEAQLVLAAERQQRAVGVFANRSQRLYARQLLLRCFLALRLDCTVSRQHAATGTWTRGFHGQRARKLAFHAWRLATLAARALRRETQQLSSVVVERLASAEEHYVALLGGAPPPTPRSHPDTAIRTCSAGS